MESDISDISNIMNDPTITNWRKSLWVTTRMKVSLRHFIRRSTN